MHEHSDPSKHYKKKNRIQYKKYHELDDMMFIYRKKTFS